MEPDTTEVRCKYDNSFVELGLLYNIIITICYETQQTLKLQLKFNQIISFA